MDTIPRDLPVWIWFWISEVFPSRMELDSAVEPSRISKAGIRPPPFLRSSC
jgi:hypothetical protein